MPKITYRPFNRLDPMLNEAPTRYSPRPLPKSERAQASSGKNNDPSAAGTATLFGFEREPNSLRFREVGRCDLKHVYWSINRAAERVMQKAIISLCLEKSLARQHLEALSPFRPV